MYIHFLSWKRILWVRLNLFSTALWKTAEVKGRTSRLPVWSLQLQLLTYLKRIKFGGGSIFGVGIFSIREWLNNDKLVNIYCDITVNAECDPL